MKKILLTTVVALALSSLSVQADLLKIKHEHNWNNVTMSDSKMSDSKMSDSKMSDSNYSASLKSTKVEKKKAKKAGMEWNTIRKLMKSAAKKHKAGNDKGAIKLLKVAKEHAILGQRQAIDQANAGPNF